MKELSIEEKAKRYDEAIKRAKELLEIGVKDTRDKRVVLSFFPELKESEDEIIRKQLIKYVKSGLAGFPQCEKWLAWLEKQDNKKDIHLLELKAKAYDDARERMSYAYNQNRVPIGFISEIFPNLNSYENHDDKPQGKSALEAINEEMVDNANKIEPQFNLCDWVVTDKGDTVQIGAVNNGYYTLYNGMDFNMSYVDKCWHRWTIEDAKDGDVLCYKDEISLYKHDIKNCTKQEPNFGGFVCYCCYDGKRFIVDSLYSLIEQDKMDIHPATKEQHDNLFQKMKEAGYEWDKDKKELIKL